jgi:hypothetical protein
MLMKLIYFFIILFSASLLAQETDVPLKAQESDGTIKRVRAFLYHNHWGRKEVRIESAALPKVGSVNPVFGYGRDTDDDGKIDTWFMIDSDEGLKIHHIKTRQQWGLDVIEHQLLKRYESSRKSHISAAYGAIFGFLLMSVSHGWSSERELWRELMDIEEFSLRLHRSRSSGEITREQWEDSVDLIVAAYDQTIKRFERATGKEYWALAGADIVLWATGGIIAKFLSKGIGVIGRPVAQTAIMKDARIAVTRIAKGIKEKAHSQLIRFRGLKGTLVNALAAQAVKKRFPSQMRALMARNILYRKVIPPIMRTGIAVKKAALDWNYIAFMTGLQLTTEAFANSSEVWSSNPTTFARNVLSHPDIIQNVTYMSSNAFLMTAASHGIRAKGMRFAICGFIAMANSTISNIVIRGERDYERITLDTGWEAVVGNAQIQLDLAALKHFEQRAMRTGNPQMKLLGWAVVFVDQALGFAGYSKAAEYVSQNDKVDVQLVPVLAE